MFKKILIILMIGCLLLGMATRAEVENVKEEAEKEVKKESAFIGAEITPMMKEFDSLIKPEEEPDLYKIDLNPETPTEEKTRDEIIDSGHVIAYGHYIKPPYKVEIKNDTMLFVNGVQIFPSLPSKYEIEKKRREEIWANEKFGEARIIAEPYFKRRESLFEEMKKVYKVLEAKEGRVKAIDSVFKLAKKDTLVVELDTTLVGEDDCTFLVDYFMPGYNHISGLILRLYGGDTSSGYSTRPTPLRKDVNAFRESVIRSKKLTEKALRSGYVIFYTFKDTGYRREYRLWQILKVLKSDTLNVQEKIEKLSEIANENAAKELVYNFDPSEWPVEKEVNEK